MVGYDIEAKSKYKNWKEVTKMHKLLTRTKGLGAGLSALVLVAVAAMPALLGINPVYAGQVATRSIKMSSASIGTATAGTGVSYLVTFTPATTGAQSLVLDFCNTAIIGGACTAPAGMSAASATFTGSGAFLSWTSTMTASTVKLTRGTGTALGTAAVSFTIGNITNPSAVGSFYARLTTYTDTTYGGYTSPTAPGTYSDNGGFALSTVNTIAITATVQETLTFCTSKVAPATSCTSTTAPTLTLGAGSPVILGTTVATDTAFTQLSTNALTGAIVRMSAFSNSGTVPACAGLSRDGGATCPIAAKGVFGPIANGSALFGLNVSDGTPLAGGSGTVTADADYGTTAGSYGMAATTLSLYGDPIQSSTSAVADVNSTLTFAAAASNTTPAGVYSANESLVATGTF